MLTVVGDVDGWTAPEYVPFRRALRARAASPDLEGRVHFLGWRDDVVSVMANADVHCAPSLPEIREGFGLVNLEAKQAGIPSVVFPSGAYPEVITHKIDGWVCTDISAEGLAEGLEYFLTSVARRDAAAEAARRSLARFDVRVFEDSWWNVFSPSGVERRTSSAIAGAIPARGEVTR
jgi:glycosyltransferase involved in cell wall biosynthesis